MTRSRPAVLFLNTRRTELEHVPAFDAADELGLDVVLITDTQTTGARGSRSREVHVVDTYDADAVLAVAQDVASRMTVAGVTTWSDRDVVTVAQLAEALGLPGPSVKAAGRARNKATMRQALAHRPELIPAFHVVRGRDDLAAGIEAVGFPAVLKPTTGSGSKGIFLVDTAEEAHQAWEHLAAYTTSGGDRVFEQSAGELILERRLLGTEHSVEGVVSRGSVQIAGVADKSTTPDFRLEAAHELPTALPADVVSNVERLTREVVTELGLDDCAFHLECIVDEDGDARLVEVAARVGGDYITSHLVPMATGRSFYTDVLRVVTGQEPATYGAEPQAVAGVRKLFATTAGTFAGVDGWAELENAPSVTATCLERASGARITLPPHDFMSCVVGAVIGRRPYAERDRLRDELDQATAALKIRVTEE